MKTQELVKVVFKYHAKNKDLFAFFPEFKDRNGYFASYAHVGQHSDCCILYAKEARNAKPHEYEELKKELEQIGYNLIIKKRI